MPAKDNGLRLESMASPFPPNSAFKYFKVGEDIRDVSLDSLTATPDSISTVGTLGNPHSFLANMAISGKARRR